MRNKGLSLLEILVATLILALLMIGLGNIFVAGKRLILHSRSRMTGGELGKHFLDILQMDVREDEWATNSNCLKGGLGCPEPQNVDNIIYAPNYNFTDVSGTTLRRAIVNISWDERSP